MTKLGVIFGGRSCEHDVSIITGQQLIQNVDKQKYNITPLYVNRDGRWYTGSKLLDIEFMRNFNEYDSEITEVFFPATSGYNGVYTKTVEKKGLFKTSVQSIQKIELDVVINAIHGLHGEDGSVAGLLELADIPYANTGIMGSSVGMDKIIMKAVFRSYGFPVLDDLCFCREQYQKDKRGVLSSVQENLGFPVFVKPANLGSSIGISKAVDEESLQTALHVAFSYDRRVLVEKGVSNLYEINCSCIGYNDDVKASVCEMPVSFDELLDFDAKYLRGGKGKGMENLSRKIPAPIPQKQSEEIQQLSIDIFKSLDCKGVVRIDYLVDKESDKVYVGEINTHPGSFAFYLWDYSGLKYTDMIDELIAIANKAFVDKHKNTYAYDSEILTKVSIGGKLGNKCENKFGR